MRNYEKLREQDQRDVYGMAYANNQALHYSTKTTTCKDPLLCLLCMESARLAVQWYRPRIEKRVVESIIDAYDVRCNMTHISSDD